VSNHSVLLTLEMMALQSLGTMRIMHPMMTQCHILDNLNPQQHRCENLKSWYVQIDCETQTKPVASHFTYSVLTAPY